MDPRDMRRKRTILNNCTFGRDGGMDGWMDGGMDGKEQE
jgi:hypothetical protein